MFRKKSPEERHQIAHQQFAETTFAVYLAMINGIGFEYARRRLGGSASSEAEIGQTVASAIERERKSATKRGVGMGFSDDLLLALHRTTVAFVDRQLERDDLRQVLDSRVTTLSIREAEARAQDFAGWVLDQAINRRAFAWFLRDTLTARGVSADPSFIGELELQYLLEAVEATAASAATGDMWASLQHFAEEETLAIHRALAEFCWEANGQVQMTWPELSPMPSDDSSHGEPAVTNDQQPRAQGAEWSDSPPNNHLSAEIERLVALYERGVLNDEEFATAKQRALGL